MNAIFVVVGSIGIAILSFLAGKRMYNKYSEVLQALRIFFSSPPLQQSQQIQQITSKISEFDPEFAQTFSQYIRSSQNQIQSFGEVQKKLQQSHAIEQKLQAMMMTAAAHMEELEHSLETEHKKVLAESQRANFLEKGTQSLRKQISELQQQASEHERIAKEKEQQCHTLSVERDKFSAKIHEIEHAYSELRSELDTAHSQELQSLQNTIHELQSKLQHPVETNEDDKQYSLQIIKIRTELQRSLSTTHRLSEERKKLESQISSLQTKNAQLESDIATLRTTQQFHSTPVLHEPIMSNSHSNTDDMAEELENMAMEIMELTGKLDQAMYRATNLQISYNLLNKDYYKLESDFEELHKREAENRLRLKALQSQVAEKVDQTAPTSDDVLRNRTIADIEDDHYIPTILVVDDSSTNLKVLSMILARIECNIITATNGTEAIEKTREVKPDIILLDVILPDIHGFEVCRQIKEEPEFERIPIIFLSAISDSSSKVQGFSVGGVDYITKPFEEAETLERVKLHIRLHHMEQRLNHSINELRFVVEREAQKSNALEELTAEMLEAQQSLEKANAELEKATLAANTANRAKSTFLANMSHELRTPLNAIIGFAQVLQQNSSLGELQQTQVEAMYKSGLHLLSIINDVLDLSKIEAGYFEVTPAPFDLHSFLHDFENIFSNRCQVKGLLFSIKTAQNLPQVIVSDEVRLRQVFMNLLGNAIKFTQKGGVTFEISAIEVLEKTAKLRFAIQDTGRGIPEDQISSIMEPFQQVNGMRSEGTGLGLGISNKIVQKLGAEQIFIESTLDVGSTFWFEIPVEIIPESSEIATKVLKHAPTVTYSLAGNISPLALIADDSATNRAVLRNILLPLGFELHEAHNGQELVELSRLHKADVILTDIVMPVLDGVQAMKIIRAETQTPIIALTAGVIDSNLETLRNDGFDGVLEKPFLVEDLLELIQKTTAIPFVVSESDRSHAGTSENSDYHTNEFEDFISRLEPETVHFLQELVDYNEFYDIARWCTSIQHVSEHDTGIVQRIQREAEAENIIFFTRLNEILLKYT